MSHDQQHGGVPGPQAVCAQSVGFNSELITRPGPTALYTASESAIIGLPAPRRRRRRLSGSVYTPSDPNTTPTR